MEKDLIKRDSGQAELKQMAMTKSMYEQLKEVEYERRKRVEQKRIEAQNSVRAQRRDEMEERKEALERFNGQKELERAGRIRVEPEKQQAGERRQSEERRVEEERIQSEERRVEEERIQSEERRVEEERIQSEERRVEEEKRVSERESRQHVARERKAEMERLLAQQRVIQNEENQRETDRSKQLIDLKKQNELQEEDSLKKEEKSGMVAPLLEEKIQDLRQELQDTPSESEDDDIEGASIGEEEEKDDPRKERQELINIVRRDCLWTNQKQVPESVSQREDDSDDTGNDIEQISEEQDEEEGQNSTDAEEECGDGENDIEGPRSDEGDEASSDAPEDIVETTKDKSVRRRTFNWLNKRFKRRIEKKIAKTFLREQTEGENFCLKNSITLKASDRIQSRADREREKREKLIDLEESRRCVEEQLQNYWTAKRAKKEAQREALRLKEEARYEKWIAKRNGNAVRCQPENDQCAKDELVEPPPLYPERFKPRMTIWQKRKLRLNVLED